MRVPVANDPEHGRISLSRNQTATMAAATSREVIPLSAGWQFKQADKPDEEYRAVGQFPTNVHLDLLHHKLIPDPYIGKNELEVQWVGETIWVYRTAFASPSTAAGAKAVIAFDGLDTFATVVLNGTTILETDNMFIPERVDVTDVLAKGEGAQNELVITFDSAYLRGWKLVEKYPDHKWGVWNGDVSRLAVRKTQYHWVRMPGSSGRAAHANRVM
jgi:beta-mannosidase